MAIITLLTDFGPFSHRLAKLKGRLLGTSEQMRVVDISHSNALMDMREPAFLLRSSYNSFPENTIHLCCIAPNEISDSCIIAEKNGQFFVSFDNGFLSLSIGKENVNYFLYKHEASKNDDLSAIDVLTDAALKLIESHFETASFTEVFSNPLERSFEKPVESGNVIRISVQYIDYFGNVYTNLPKEQFENFTKDNAYSIRISREYKLNKVHHKYSDVRPGEMVAIFGDGNVLQLSINQGNFAHLMASEIGTPFIIEQL